MLKTAYCSPRLTFSFIKVQKYEIWDLSRNQSLWVREAVRSDSWGPAYLIARGGSLGFVEDGLRLDLDVETGELSNVLG